VPAAGDAAVDGDWGDAGGSGRSPRGSGREAAPARHTRPVWLAPQQPLTVDAQRAERMWQMQQQRQRGQGQGQGVPSPSHVPAPPLLTTPVQPTGSARSLQGGGGGQPLDDASPLTTYRLPATTPVGGGGAAAATAAAAWHTPRGGPDTRVASAFAQQQQQQSASLTTSWEGKSESEAAWEAALAAAPVRTSRGHGSVDMGRGGASGPAQPVLSPHQHQQQLAAASADRPVHPAVAAARLALGLSPRGAAAQSAAQPPSQQQDTTSPSSLRRAASTVLRPDAPSLGGGGGGPRGPPASLRIQPTSPDYIALDVLGQGQQGVASPPGTLRPLMLSPSGAAASAAAGGSFPSWRAPSTSGQPQVSPSRAGPGSTSRPTASGGAVVVQPAAAFGVGGMAPPASARR
jgi:hypothetical protein